ncbi:MAG: hypothetical protein JSS12_07840, partial [Verrucomicrobia bacterium]|nr:hypothetical protein [Verrucomicrobiota bacterium]
FFDHKDSSGFIAFAKTDKKSANTLVAALIGKVEPKKGTHSMAADWYAKLTEGQKEDWNAIMQLAGRAGKQ